MSVLPSPGLRCWGASKLPQKNLDSKMLDTGGGGGGRGDFEGPSSLHSFITAEETLLVQPFSLFASLHQCRFTIIKVTFVIPIKACERNTHLLSQIQRRQFSLLCFSWSCENSLSHFALLYSHDRLEVKSLSAPQTQHNSPGNEIRVFSPARSLFFAWFSFWSFFSCRRLMLWCVHTTRLL